MSVDQHRIRHPPPPRRQLRHGVWLSLASVGWTVAVSAAEVALGLTHHILTLVVFGLAGALDAAGSATLVIHFRHALRHDLLAERHERRATLVISAGLLLLGLLTLAASGQRLAQGHGGRATTAGNAIAAASVVVLAVLAVAKRRVGRRLGSTALVADGWLSASGALLAVFAVLGATLGAHRDLWWVDPVAALVIAAVAGAYGTTVLAREQRRHVNRRSGDGARSSHDEDEPEQDHHGGARHRQPFDRQQGPAPPQGSTAVHQCHCDGAEGDGQAH